jgi:quinol monooxygenase YgiN
MRGLVVAIVMLAASSLSATAQSIRTSVNIDVMPDHLAEGLAALKDYLAEAKRDPTLESIQLAQRIDAPNHFILDLKMADRASYATHIQSWYVRQFRERLFPYLGSPWDERLYQDIK